MATRPDKMSHIKLALSSFDKWIFWQGQLNLYCCVARAPGRSKPTAADYRMHQLSRGTALLLFSIIVVVWGMNWTVTKTLVASVSPLWTTAIRSAIGAVMLLGLLTARRQFILPRRGDVAV